MIKNLTKEPLVIAFGKPIGLVVFLGGCILLTALIDFLESKYQGSGFYLVESLLFSSYWWIFLPLWYSQLRFFDLCKTKTNLTLLIVFPIVIHLFAFPSLVWLISSLFYEHTFEFGRTFQFGFIQHFFKIILLYSIPIIVVLFLNNRVNKQKPLAGIAGDESNGFLTSMTIKDGSRQLSIPTKEILYIKANPPYIYINHNEKKYLYQTTLKSISEKLDSRLFVRIHKSEIVNLSNVISYKSRQNGDYDVTVSDGAILRISRNYAKDFKTKLERLTQNTV